MKRVVFAAAMVIGLGIGGGVAGAADSVPDGELKNILRDRVEKLHHGTCIVVGIIDPRGSIVVSYGTLSRTNKRAADADTVFEIGSATKVFTGLLLADAVEKHQVKLDDPVGKLLPPSVKVPSRNGRQIELVDLATHTSGLPRLPDNLIPADPANPYADYTPQKLYDFLSSYALPRDIGSKFEYSNLGVGLLGSALARRAGTSYEDLVVKEICSPLAMSATRITLSRDLDSRLAEGHLPGGRRAANWDMATLAGAGGIRSTVNDLLKFLTANLNPPQSSLGRAMALAQTPRHEADLPNMDVALCWHIAKSPAGNIIWHNGETAGYHSFIGFDRRKQEAVVVLSNAAGTIDDIGFQVLDSTRPLVQPPKQRTAITLAPEILDRYVGRYELAPDVFFNIRTDGNHLMAQLTGQGYSEIFPESETGFFYKVVDAQLTFERDDHGKVGGLVLHQNGVDQRAKKISGQPPAERKTVTLDSKLYDAFAGDYELAPGAIFTIRREGDRLMVQFTGQPSFEVFPESDHEFFYKVVDAQITFVKDGDGRVTALIIHQNGQSREARKTR